MNKIIQIVLYSSLLFACTKHKALPGNGDYLKDHTEVSGYIYEHVTGLRVANAKITLYEGKTGNGLFANYYEVDSIRSNKNGEYHFNYTPKENRFYAMGAYELNHLGGSSHASYPIVDYYKTTDYNIALIPLGYIRVNIHCLDTSIEQAMGLNLAYCNSGLGAYKQDNTYLCYFNGGENVIIRWDISAPFKPNKTYFDSIYVIPHDTVYYQINY